MTLISCDTWVICRSCSLGILSTKRQHQPPTETNPLKSPRFLQKGPRGGKNWSHNKWAPHNSLLITKQEKLNFFQTSAAKRKHFPHAKNTNKSVLVQLRAGSTAHSLQPQAALIKNTEFRTQMFRSCFQSHYLTVQLLENIHLPWFLSPLYKCSYAQRAARVLQELLAGLSAVFLQSNRSFFFSKSILIICQAP